MLGIHGSSECSRKDASSIKRDIGGLNIKCPPPPILEAFSYPEETDSMYRWFAFPVDAPPRGTSRSTRVRKRNTCHMTQMVVMGRRNIGWLRR